LRPFLIEPISISRKNKHKYLPHNDEQAGNGMTQENTFVQKRE
jgi:hypothetical protein